LVAVCGASVATDQEWELALRAGRLLADRGAVVVCGGRGGVMDAVARGVRDGGGICIGLLPGEDDPDVSEALTVALTTGLGEMRNALIARVSRAMIVIGGGYGTLSEIGMALRLGRPLVALHSWEVRPPGGQEPDPGMHRADTAEEAVDWVLQRISG
jgi:uncharacterized protein (TIGR00725 family)